MNVWFLLFALFCFWLRVIQIHMVLIPKGTCLIGKTSIPQERSRKGHGWGMWGPNPSALESRGANDKRTFPWCCSQRKGQVPSDWFVAQCAFGSGKDVGSKRSDDAAATIARHCCGPAGVTSWGRLQGLLPSDENERNPAQSWSEHLWNHQWTDWGMEQSGHHIQLFLVSRRLLWEAPWGDSSGWTHAHLCFLEIA